jgi:hypothetical protein
VELDEPSNVLALPAAHSMDTHWFAVDELGHVAMFASGETGPVPDVAGREWPQGSSFGVDVVPLLADAEVLSYEAADIFAVKKPGLFARMFAWPEVIEKPPRFDQSLSSVLLQLRSLEGARERLSAVGFHVLPSREGAYAWGNVESPMLRELWNEGWIVRAALGHSLSLTRMGMFYFEHEDEEWSEAEDVYRLVDAPRMPVRVHALPTSLRRRIGAARFADLDFRECETIRVGRATAGDGG